jgi:hypothetical protein
LIDKHEIVTSKLKKCGRIYRFPVGALTRIDKSRANVRKGRDELPLVVSRPPHIIVDAARRFAVYSDEFIAVPARWIGIAGGAEHKELLQALALYISSDFSMYHQFLISPQMGVYKARADLKTLKQLPVPIANIQRQGVAKWAELYRRLVLATRKPTRKKDLQLPLAYPDDSVSADVSPLEAEVNELTYEALKLRKSDIALISDLVHRRRLLIQGKVDPLATGAPSETEMRLYCETLKRQLDAFFEVATDDRHNVDVIHENESAMIVAQRGPAQPLRQSIRIIAADKDRASALGRVRDRLVERRRQWLYFHRDFRKYQNGTTYLFKPMQLIHWLPSQALIDAREVFADKTGGGQA